MYLEVMSGTSKSKSLLPDAAGLPGAEDSADPPDGPAQEFGLADWWFHCCTGLEGCTTSGCCLTLPENQPRWISQGRLVHMTLSPRCCQLHELYHGPDRTQSLSRHSVQQHAVLGGPVRKIGSKCRRLEARTRNRGKLVGRVDSCAITVTRPSSRCTDV